MIKVYNKLVRDRIPEIIEADGKKCKIENLSDGDYLKMIDEKLDEELAGYHKEQNIEELADLNSDGIIFSTGTPSTTLYLNLTFTFPYSRNIAAPTG